MLPYVGDRLSLFYLLHFLYQMLCLLGEHFYSIPISVLKIYNAQVLIGSSLAGRGGLNWFFCRMLLKKDCLYQKLLATRVEFYSNVCNV